MFTSEPAAPAQKPGQSTNGIVSHRAKLFVSYFGAVALGVSLLLFVNVLNWGKTAGLMTLGVGIAVYVVLVIIWLSATKQKRESKDNK